MRCAYRNEGNGNAVCRGSCNSESGYFLIGEVVKCSSHKRAINEYVDITNVSLKGHVEYDSMRFAVIRVYYPCVCEQHPYRISQIVKAAVSTYLYLCAELFSVQQGKNCPRKIGGLKLKCKASGASLFEIIAQGASRRYGLAFRHGGSRGHLARDVIACNYNAINAEDILCPDNACASHLKTCKFIDTDIGVYFSQFNSVKPYVCLSVATIHSNLKLIPRSDIKLGFFYVCKFTVFSLILKLCGFLGDRHCAKHYLITSRLIFNGKDMSCRKLFCFI